MRGIVKRAAKGEPRAAKQALDLMKEYGLLKNEDVEHRVIVELVKPKERSGDRKPEKSTRPKPLNPLKSRKN